MKEHKEGCCEDCKGKPHYHFERFKDSCPCHSPQEERTTTEENKCPDCDLGDEHIFPEDRSTTRISRPCSGCGKHQTIAGALLKSEYWKKWYDHASKNMLYDVDETLTVDAMSDGHFGDFMRFALLQERQRMVERVKN